MSDTPALGLPLILAEQAQKHVTHNEALRLLDTIVQLSVLDRDLSAPPGAPAEGSRYLIAAGATGAWAGREHEIAIRQDGGWAFLQPGEGWLCWVRDEDVCLVFNGAVWVQLGGGGGSSSELQNLTRLGLGTAADAGNPFAAKLNKALWTAKTAAEGGDGDLRYTLNKESAADVLSLLFQTGFSGRLELGLIGGDDLSLKVSADGVAWTEAIRVDRATGNLGLGVTPADALHMRRSGPNAARVVVEGESAVNNQVRRVSANGLSANFVVQKARGSIGAEAAPVQNDILGGLIFQGYDGVSVFRTGAQIATVVTAATPSAADMQSRVVVSASAPGASVVSEVMRLEHGAGLSLFGDNPVIDGNRHFRLRAYTLGTLPDATVATGQMIFCSDLGGGGGQLNSDGASWRRVSRGGQQTIGTNAGMTLVPLTHAEEIRHTGALTANRMVTLSNVNAYPGARFRVTRTGSGASLLSVGGLKDLAQNGWCEVIHDGTAWYLAASGTL